MPMLGAKVTFLNDADRKNPIQFKAQSNSGNLTGTISYGSSGIKINTAQYNKISFNWANSPAATAGSDVIDLSNYKNDTTVKIQSQVFNQYSEDGSYSEWDKLVPDRTGS